MIFGWILKISSIFYNSKRQIQNNICHKLGCIYLKGDFFGMKNKPLTFQKVVTITFKEYLDTFMKTLLDDHIVYSDMETHLQKIKLCFQKCKEYNINLNLKECTLWYVLESLLDLLFQNKVSYLIRKKYK